MKTILVWNDKRIVVRRFADEEELDGDNQRCLDLREMLHGKSFYEKDDPRWQILDGEPEVDAEEPTR